MKTKIGSSVGSGQHLLNKRRLVAYWIPVFAVLILSLVIAETAIAKAAYTIRIDRHGGDCTKIGMWDYLARKCTLSGDVIIAGDGTRIDKGIEIAADNITLQGNNYLLYGSWPPVKYGIYLAGRTGVIIAGLNFYSFRTAIFIGGSFPSSSRNFIIKNTIQNFFNNGIWVSGKSNEIRENLIDNTPPRIKGVGIEISGEKQYVVRNTVKGTYYGIHLSVSHSAIVRNNTVERNEYALAAFAGDQNRIYNNNFLSNGNSGIILEHCSLNFGLPYGGNHWSEYDRPEEGCWDWDDDDICDSPFVINGSLNVKDNFPWVLKDGWKNDVNQSLTYLEDYVVHLRMEEEIENSILLKLYHAERVLEQGNYEQAIDHLESLVFQTESLEGKELYEIQAKEIIQLLQYTVDVLNKIDW